MRHIKYLARTVLVKENNVEEACRVLNRILGKEDIFDQFRRTRYYEKPFQVDQIRLHRMFIKCNRYFSKKIFHYRLEGE